MSTITRKHTAKYCNIAPELRHPRWHVLKVNIEHHEGIMLKDKINNATFPELAASHRKVIFHHLEELKRYDYMWDAVMPTEERKLFINSIN